MKEESAGLSRRGFVSVAAALGGGLVVGFVWSSRRHHHNESEHESRHHEFRPNAWLHIARTGQITVIVEKPELGQGSRTYTAMMVAEELEADWSDIRVEQAPTIPAIYKELRTGGSAGVATTFLPMRRVGAQARELLTRAAARRWSVPATECQAERSRIVHASTGRSFSYGELADDASRLLPLESSQLPLKPAREFRIIGTSPQRLDLPEKIDGRACFGIDVRVPGMLFAVIARCPYFGGTLTSFDDSRASRVPGVQAIFPIAPLPRRFNTAGGVAVVANSTWAAMQGRKALSVRWGKPAGVAESTAALRERMIARAAGAPEFVAVERGGTERLTPGSARTLSASYESPFQAHAPMEPMNTTVHVRTDAIEVWSPTQFADEVQREIAELSGVPLEHVIVHMTLSGGSFGRRYQWDYAAEAWQVARRMSAPVQVMWTREDDLQHDFYRPYNYQSLAASMDEHGNVSAWSARIVTTAIAPTNVYTGMDDSAAALSKPSTVAALEWYGADVKPYAIPTVHIDYAPVGSPVPRSWWRSVSSSFTTFARECFIDELAHFVGRDPIDIRLQWLRGNDDESRMLRNVLQLAARHSGWGTSLGGRCGRGIASRSGETASAQVAEVCVRRDGTVDVRRVVAVIDCGVAVNPDGIRAMTEGAINFGLTAALLSEIHIVDGAVPQSNFHDYRVLRIEQAPRIDVHIVPSEREPSGVGELGTMLIGPAIANAVFAAIGVRPRRLPIDPSALAHV